MEIRFKFFFPQFRGYSNVEFPFVIDSFGLKLCRRQFEFFLGIIIAYYPSVKLRGDYVYLLRRNAWNKSKWIIFWQQPPNEFLHHEPHTFFLTPVLSFLLPPFPDTINRFKVMISKNQINRKMLDKFSPPRYFESIYKTLRIHTIQISGIHEIHFNFKFHEEMQKGPLENLTRHEWNNNGLNMEYGRINWWWHVNRYSWSAYIQRNWARLLHSRIEAVVGLLPQDEDSWILSSITGWIVICVIKEFPLFGVHSHFCCR